MRVSNLLGIVSTISLVTIVAVPGVYAQKVYWSHFKPAKIQRANLDGSGVEEILSTGAARIALDLPRSKIYWTTGSTVRRADLDGT